MRTLLSARALLIDPQDRVLLMRLAAGHVSLSAGHRSAFWVTPGGSLEAGESFDTALLRELQEETGLALVDPGRVVWIGEKEVIRNGERLLTIAHVYAQRVAAFEPTPQRFTDEEHEAFRGFRWWSVDEIAASQDRFVPRGLAVLLTSLLRGDWPSEPLRIDV